MNSKHQAARPCLGFIIQAKTQWFANSDLVLRVQLLCQFITKSFDHVCTINELYCGGARIQVLLLQRLDMTCALAYFGDVT